MQAVDKWRQSAADLAKAATPLAARRRVLRARLGLRTRTARWRDLPDLVVIGAQRCGTSSLYKWLGRHPNVAPSLRKEIEYFSTDHAKGAGWYRAHFPLTVRRRLAARRGKPFVTFEATPDYLFDPRAPRRVRELVPETKLIALLREPADRAVSQYYHNIRLGHEPLGLEAALRAEEERLAEGWERFAADPDYRAIEIRRFGYLARGRYAEQLERWLDAFPRSQLLALRSEDLYARPGETFERILGFIGLPSWQPPEFRNYSYAATPDGAYPEPSAAVGDFLAARLAEPNARLVELLGDEFRWDAPAAP